MRINLEKKSVLQNWVQELSFMQQSVLFTAVRGPDNTEKYSPAKYILRWYRRCILLSAFDKCVLENPYDQRGGSFTGPSFSYTNANWHQTMDEEILEPFIRQMDVLPFHFIMHFLHASEILGYKHPDKYTRLWWNKTYIRLVQTFHLYPETEKDMERRLGDSREQWLERSDSATTE